MIERKESLWLISKGGREFAQKWRMIKQLKLAAKAKTAPTLKRDCLIDDRKKNKVFG